MKKNDLYRILNALWPAMAFVALLVGVHALQVFVLGDPDGYSYRDRLPLNAYGMRPRRAEGLVGVLTMPFLHGSWNHLYNNSIALLFLGWTMMYFYRSLVFRTVAAIVIFNGLWLWLAGEEGSNHIGASGLLYGLVTFLFFSGITRAYKPLIAISMLIVFLYGSLIWGIFPIKDNVSWEGHLWGGVAGIVMAFYYKYAGPQRPKYRWEIEDDEADNAPDAPWRQIDIPDSSGEEPQRRIVYHYRAQTKSPSAEPKTPGDDSAS